MNNFLVTGGAGFIGSHIAEGLVKAGHSVRILDNFLTGKKENIETLQKDIELIIGDIRDLVACQKAVEGIDAVLHQAALPSVARSIEDPLLSHDINVNGTLNILLASRDAGVKKVIFASTASLYGDDRLLPKQENMRETPLSPYAISKLIGEKYSQIFSQVYELSTVCLRYFNVFGPRQDPFSSYAAVIPSFIIKMLKGERCTIFGDGEQTRDFTYVKNVVEANLSVLKNKNISGEIINVAAGEETSINVLSQEVARILDFDEAPKYEESRKGDIRHSYADISKLKELIKYTPSVSFKEGLAETIEWYKGNV
jgi:UDP-glucose 4-epimerase